MSLPDNWITPFYMNILHGNYATEILRDAERITFNAAVRQALETVTADQLAGLIQSFWRQSITGSWLAGLGGFIECRDQIGARLLASETCYAGQAHAFAMACFADDESARFLEDYLDHFLRRPDCYYDQDWAMPALMWIDHQTGSNRSARLLSKGGLWESFTADKLGENDAWSIEDLRDHFWSCMDYCRQHFSRP